MTRKSSRAKLIWRRHIARFCDVWLCASNRSSKTIRAYRADLKQFARQLPRSVSPHGVRQTAIEAWVAKLQKRGYAAASVRRKLASLRAFYAYLIASARISKSPMEGLSIRLGAPKRLTRVVPRYDIRNLVSAAEREAGRAACRGLKRRERLLRMRNVLIVRLLCATGVRVGELVAVQTDDVRQRDRTLTIRGKGNRERMAYVADLPTASLLDRYIAERRRGNHKGNALFENGSGKAITTETVRQLIRRLGKTASTTSRITPHMLRHTAATSLLENGADLRVVQEFLGHNSIRSTERYTHVAPKYFRRVLRRANPLKWVA